MKPQLKSLWNENKGLFLFLLLMVTFRSALADWNSVPTGSMKPTILEGDRIWVNKVAFDIRLPFIQTPLFHLADPVRGDIVVFNSEKSKIRLVKRVIAVPGDTVSMDNNRLKLNGENINYEITSQHKVGLDFLEVLPGAPHMVRISDRHSQLATFSSLEIPDGHYLVLGDNRNNSADSRVIGLVPRNEIIGRARSVVMSLDYDNYYLPRRSRFLKSL